MIDASSVPSLVGSTVRDSSGGRIGKVGQVYLDDTTGVPEWVTVRTGLFGSKESFVPLAAARVDGDELVVDASKDKVSNAPRIDEDGHVSPDQEQELYRYYGVSAEAAAAALGQGGDAGRSTTSVDTPDQVAASGHHADTGTVGRDTSGPVTDDAMTRSEERLSAGTERVETGRARLRKYVVTEMQQVSVPVRREEVRLEREPITDANRDAAHDGPAISEDEHEMILHAERPVITTETVPVERVRLGKETVSDTETVSGEVRKEQIEIDDPTGTTRDRDAR